MVDSRKTESNQPDTHALGNLASENNACGAVIGAKKTVADILLESDIAGSWEDSEELASWVIRNAEPEFTSMMNGTSVHASESEPPPEVTQNIRHLTESVRLYFRTFICLATEREQMPLNEASPLSVDTRQTLFSPHMIDSDERQFFLSSLFYEYARMIEGKLPEEFENLAKDIAQECLMAADPYLYCSMLDISIETASTTTELLRDIQLDPDFMRKMGEDMKNRTICWLKTNSPQ